MIGHKHHVVLNSRRFFLALYELSDLYIYKHGSNADIFILISESTAIL